MASAIMDKLKKRADAVQTTAEREVFIPLEKVRFDPSQPRKAYHTLDGRIAEKDQAYIEELAATIKAQGLIQAITVEELPNGEYLVRVGECRTRAHLLLGEKTIRAVINNGLQKRRKCLLYQLAENVNRNDLTDFEIAGVVKELMEPSDDDEPMNQAQVAQELGKSEGWVTRFVAFGDEELQRRWVQPGIADTAEKLYRLKLLPQHIQLEVLRRVDLPAEDPERLEKPLKRAVIDDFAARAKMEKQRQRSGKANDGGVGKPLVNSAPVALPSGHAASPAGESGAVAPATGKPAANDSIGQALAEAAAKGRKSGDGGKPAGPVAVGGQTHAAPVANDYTLPESMRQELIQGAQASNAADGEKRRRANDTPPVNCRVQLSNLEALLPLLRTTPDLLKAMRNVRCEVSIPGDVAKSIATALVGMVVDDQELSATMQNELAKLG